MAMNLFFGNSSKGFTPAVYKSGALAVTGKLDTTNDANLKSVAEEILGTNFELDSMARYELAVTDPKGYLKDRDDALKKAIEGGPDIFTATYKQFADDADNKWPDIVRRQVAKKIAQTAVDQEKAIVEMMYPRNPSAVASAVLAKKVCRDIKSDQEAVSMIL
jgi:hypothetical protein